MNRSFSALLPILLLAPLSIAAKGCGPAVIGDDCPDGVICSVAGGPGAAGSSSAGGPSAGSGNGSAGHSSAGAGTGGSPSAQTCGGLLGLGCDASHYCVFTPEAACGSGDQTGTCQPKPETCDLVYAPVCGCDGKTYSSECQAADAGVSVAKNGACQTDPSRSCGGLLGLGCATGEFCDFPADAMCGAADQTGTCVKKGSGACPDIYAPVCGCDGKSYPNQCAANNAGVSVTNTGTCAAPGKACGGLTGGGCAKGEFCNYPPEVQCGAADGLGQCTVIPNACTDEYAPVCGCDGKTYSTACVAASAGMSVAAHGECK